MSDRNEDFEQLRKLLKIKRYEQAPPGYFNRLPERITARIEREGNQHPLSWFARLRLVLSENPITSGIFAVCGILMMVIANSEYLDQYVAGDSGSTLAVTSMEFGGSDRAANGPEGLRTGGLKVAAVQETVFPGVYPAIALGQMDSSLNAFSVNAQQVNFNFSR